MGLKEKRFINDYSDNLADRQKSISELIGSDIEVTVDWDSFNTVEEMQEVHHQALGRLLDGLRRVASDDMGKEAIAESVKKITVEHLEDPAAKAITIADGELKLSCKWGDDLTYIYTDGAIAEEVENQL